MWKYRLSLIPEACQCFLLCRDNFWFLKIMNFLIFYSNMNVSISLTFWPEWWTFAYYHYYYYFADTVVWWLAEGSREKVSYEFSPILSSDILWMSKSQRRTLLELSHSCASWLLDYSQDYKDSTRLEVRDQDLCTAKTMNVTFYENLGHDI